jgi:hypothetical protein
MTFTDRHSCVICNIEIPGVDANEEDDDPLPGVVPVIADQWMWKEPKLKMQFWLHEFRLMISIFPKITQFQFR